MKKLFLALTIAMAAIVPATAQSTWLGGKTFDNWSVGVKTGFASPLKGYRFFPNARSTMGLELAKKLTPAFGLGVESQWTVNSSSWTGLKSANAFDRQYVGVFASLNLTNIFGGLNERPRFFDLDAVVGAGWLHSYYPETVAADGNSWATKVGLNANFNLGDSQAWTISVRPSIVWNMNSKSIKPNNLGYAAAYDANAAAVNVEAALTYRFRNADGSRSFRSGTIMDEARVASLNAQINDLRRQLQAAGDRNSSIEAKLRSLQSKLDSYASAKPVVVKEVVKNLDNVSYIFFRQGSAVIEPTQQPNIEIIANALKKEASTRLTIEGYASPEGGKAANERLALKRAQAVKDALVDRYQIAPARISVAGLGEGAVFGEKEWNRVCVCTISKP